METMPTIAELAAAVAALDELDDVDRIKAVRRIVHSLPAHLAAIADADTYTASRTESQQALADRLGVTKSAVERAVTRHRARTAA